MISSRQIKIATQVWVQCYTRGVSLEPGETHSLFCLMRVYSISPFIDKEIEVQKC